MWPNKISNTKRKSLEREADCPRGRLGQKVMLELFHPALTELCKNCDNPKTKGPYCWYDVGDISGDIFNAFQSLNDNPLVIPNLNKKHNINLNGFEGIMPTILECIEFAQKKSH